MIIKRKPMTLKQNQQSLYFYEKNKKKIAHSGTDYCVIYLIPESFSFFFSKVCVTHKHLKIQCIFFSLKNLKS